MIVRNTFYPAVSDGGVLISQLHRILRPPCLYVFLVHIRESIYYCTLTRYSGTYFYTMNSPSHFTLSRCRCWHLNSFSHFVYLTLFYFTVFSYWSSPLFLQLRTSLSFIIIILPESQINFESTPSASISFIFCDHHSLFVTIVVDGIALSSLSPCIGLLPFGLSSWLVDVTGWWT